MKNWVFAFGILVGFVACKNSPSQSQMIDDEVFETRFKLSEHYSKFKFHNVKEFKIDNSCHDQLIKLNSIELKQILQHEASKGSVYYFYSTFEDTTQITVLCEDEILNTSSIKLIDYDKNGKRETGLQIAYCGALDGASWIKFGNFVNDSLYLNTNIDQQMDWETKKILEHRWVSEWTFFQDEVGRKTISDETIRIK